MSGFEIVQILEILLPYFTIGMVGFTIITVQRRSKGNAEKALKEVDRRLSRLEGVVLEGKDTQSIDTDLSKRIETLESIVVDREVERT